MSYDEHITERQPHTLTKRGLSLVIAFLLAIATVVGFGQAAHAATPGITSSILLNGETYNGTTVVNEGDTLTLRVQYDQTVAPGSTVEFDLGANVTVTGVPSTNTAIAAVTQDGNKVSITFQNPWPADVNQGVFDLTFRVNDVEESGEAPLTWQVDGEENRITVIVRDSGDQFENVVDNLAKTRTAPSNLNSFVSVDVTTGTVTVNPTILNQDISYRLNVDSEAARTGFTIADVPPAYLAYQGGSANATITTWDANGLNRTSAPFPFTPVSSGNGFTWTGDIPGPSQLAITYTTRVADEAQRLALQSALQEAYDARNGAPGAFSIPALTNTATFGDTTRTASIGIQGNVVDPNPGPNLGQAFAKTADWNPATRNVVTAEDGTLVPPADITYTLTATLAGWDGSNVNRILDRNVVIRDVLPAQAVWNTGDPAFITATGITLTEASATDCSAATTEASFAADALVGTYCVVGQTLFVNVGKDTSTAASIAVKAQLLSVDGLEQTGSTTIEDAVPYRFRNTANFYYRDGGPHNVNRDVTVVVLPDTEEGINDSSVFTKSGTAEEAVIQPGETVTVNYTFRVEANKGIDLRESTLVDYVDTDVFDVNAPGAVEISGSYDGQALTAEHFSLTTDAAGNLVIELSAAGDAIVEARGADKAFVANLSLTTTPFEGKETREITNRATLFGADGEPDYWSETDTEATSFGDEAEVRKRVYDRGSAQWVETLKAKMDGAGNLVEDTYVYRIEFIPRGSYDNVVIVPVADVLPEATEFLGFVTADNAATAADPSTSTVAIGGNIEARWEAGLGAVILRQMDGTRLNAGESIAAYVAVRVTDAEAPIVNSIGTTSATIEPLKSVSVGDYVWVDTDRDGRQDDDEPGIPGVVLVLVGPDGGSVTDVDGNPVEPAITGPGGLYTFDNLPALEGEQTYTVRIDREASAEPLAPYVPTTPGQGDRLGDSSDWEASTVPGDLHDDGDRDPTLDFGFVNRSYAIGDVVWIDADRDGVQDAGELPLSGVTVELLQGDTVVRSTFTDADGRYLFDVLEAGTYQVRFTLTDEQAATYRFTVLDAGSDDAVDSDADPATGLTRTIVLDDTNTALTGDYDRDVRASEGIDPTWDAGVILKTYAIGDVVWIDTDKDGVQDAGEAPLPGVTVELIQDGSVIDTAVTDENGRYAFDDLPGGTYRVRFVLTEEQQQVYRFTVWDAGTDDALDSDADPADGLTRTIVLDDTNTALTGDYEHREIRATEGIDPTWDAGVFVKTYALGDIVWIDRDRDGEQGEGEEPLPGVTVQLIKDGEVVDTAVTNEDGRYLFDELPGGTYQVRFVLTEEQQRTYEFTTLDAGDDDTADSDANPADGFTRTIVLDDTNTALTGDYDREVRASEGVDPTWDAGVFVKTYAIGDIVWIDENKNGVQDAGEKPLVGVIVELLQDGVVIDATTTDVDGRYAFDELPAGTYQVRFTLTEEQKATYAFTSRDAGSDDAADSDANPADGLTVTIVLDDSNDALTTEYAHRDIRATKGIDPTWDAGVVVKETPAVALPTTGEGVAIGLIAAVLALLGAGGALLLIGRRTEKAPL